MGADALCCQMLGGTLTPAIHEKSVLRLQWRAGLSYQYLLKVVSHASAHRVK